ncbi:Gamma-glutamyl-gamma-aminobutyrate hydrolase [Planctomycetales bacterium 10988]|nr:Gamma-glutamyl-gamma-aminobutyrate hydrolase [Planctomycetales bacterium 10988]
MNHKPVIAMNADFRPSKGDTPAFSYLHAGYYECILKAGGIPVVLPPMEERDDLERLLDQVDGLMMVGGADLDPRRDGYMIHPSMRLMPARRENFDRMLMDAAADRKLPFLGIGSGIQLLNVSQGGSLMFHIPEDVPRALPHKDQIDKSHRHALEVVPGTLMEQVYSDGEIRVNSAHHMAVDEEELATGFIVSARCPDGVVEAIESMRPDWWAVGVQFHPEAQSASALDQRIVEEFVEASKVATAAPVEAPQTFRLVKAA